MFHAWINIFEPARFQNDVHVNLTKAYVIESAVQDRELHSALRHETIRTLSGLNIRIAARAN
jgi:hypothetical protein